MKFEAELRNPQNKLLIKVVSAPDGVVSIWTRKHRQHPLVDGDGFQVYGNLFQPLDRAELADYFERVATALRAP